MALGQGDHLRERYRIDSILASGEFGMVYKAFDLTLSLPVVLQEFEAPNPEIVQDLQVQAVKLAGLRHPNIPRIIDQVVDQEKLVLVLDHVEGTTLRERMKQSGALRESEALPWFLEICDAVAYLHGRGVIHGDIRPGNIKFTSEMNRSGQPSPLKSGDTTPNPRRFTPRCASVTIFKPAAAVTSSSQYPSGTP